MLPRVPAPDLAFVDAEGKERSLAEFRGKLVLLNLWATWCAPCVREMPSLQRLQARLGGDRFTVLALSQDRGGLGQVQQFYATQSLKGLDIYVDKTMAAARAVKAPGLPTTLLIDPDGREIGRLVGGAEWDAPEAVAYIEWYLKGASTPVPSSTQARLGADLTAAPLPFDAASRSAIQ